MCGPIVYKQYLLVPRKDGVLVYSISNKPIGKATSMDGAKDLVDKQGGSDESGKRK